MEEYIVSIREFVLLLQILLYYELSTLRTFLFSLFLKDFRLKRNVKLLYDMSH